MNCKSFTATSRLSLVSILMDYLKFKYPTRVTINTYKNKSFRVSVKELSKIKYSRECSALDELETLRTESEIHLLEKGIYERSNSI